MSVIWMEVGATGPDSATFSVKVNGGGPVRVLVGPIPPADGVAIASTAATSSQAVDADGYAKLRISGLDPQTRYFWRVEDNGVEDTTLHGSFRTHPVTGLPASFSWAFIACAGSAPLVPGVGDVLYPERLSNHPVHLDVIARDPLGVTHMGDRGYYDPGGVAGSTVADYQRFYDDVRLQPVQHELYRSVATDWIWDNHDSWRPGGESDGTFADKGNAQQVYRQLIPHYPLPDDEAIYHAWQVGRVQFVALDLRSYRSPNAAPDGPSKTMLGSAQKSWLLTVLASSTAKYLVLISTSVWYQPMLGIGSDTWEAFPTERAELIDMMVGFGWTPKNTAIIFGDRHAMGIDSGTNSPGGYPAAQFAPLDDSTPSGGGTWFDTGPEGSAVGQYGILRFTDLGSAMIVDIEGWQGPTLWRTHRITLALEPAQVRGPEITDLVSRSHRAVVEARVLTTYQTGDDPDGDTIHPIGGDVTFDETAEIWSDMSMTVAGIDEHDRTSLFPRRATDRLAPYGNEVFLRRGVDTGAGVVWSPLGYFRLNDDQQQGSSDGEITITGQDRMCGIADAKLIRPVQFPATTSAMQMAYDLTSDVYPDIIIQWDDETDQLPIGRDILVEKDRRAALANLAASYGKVCYFDGLGVLRFESPPDETAAPVWDIAAGRDGVLIDSGRSVSRIGMPNAIVATGEGSTGQAAMGIAVDAGPDSPTRWGGRYGQVVGEFSSPLLLSNAQAERAAATRLRSLLGAVYNVSFGSVVNPSLRPRQPVWITQKDGNRSVHIVQSVTIPLDLDAAMTGTTREQRLVQVGRLGGAGDIIIL